MRLLLLVFCCRHCFLCAAAAAACWYHADAPAVAADLVPAKVKLYIFYGMPKKTKLKTIFAPLCGQSPEQVMAPAVADSHKLGYDKLYRLLLDHVSTAIALLLLITGQRVSGHRPPLCICYFLLHAFHCELMYSRP